MNLKVYSSFLLSFALMLVLSSSILGYTGLTQNVDVSSGAEKTLVKYLKALANEDVDEVLTYVIDKRYDGIEFEVQRQEYIGFLDEEKIVDYKILKAIKLASVQTRFITEMAFDTGKIAEVPVLLEFDKEWKVIIDTDSLNEDYKVIN